MNREEELIQEMESIKMASAVLAQQIAPLMKKSQELGEKWRNRETELATLKVARLREEANNFVPTREKPFTDEELAIVLQGEGLGMPLYKLAEQLISDRISGGSYNFGRYGYCPETNQAVFKISMIRGDRENYEMIFNAVTFFSKHLTPRKLGKYDKPVDKPYVLFDIMERTLSRHNSYWLHVYEDGTAAVVPTYGRAEEFDSLEKTLDYIHDNLWMESARKDKNRDCDCECDEDY